MGDNFPPYDSLRQPSFVEIIPHRSVGPRRLAPLEPPPVTPQQYPAFTTPIRDFVPGNDWSVSTHVFPAAYPRCPSDTLVAPPPHETREKQKERIAHTVSRFSALKEAQEEGKDARPSRREVLWTVANRYISKHQAQSPGLTLILLHGIGCHKETWEPVLQQLLKFRDQFNVHLPISEVWALDCVQHGDSGVLNEAELGDTFDCAEYARDLLNFLLFYLPQETGTIVPSAIPRLPDEQAQLRMRNGIEGRVIVGVGHSIGACSFVYPAVEYPNLFSSLILIESFTIPEYIKHLDAHRENETQCLRRRWLWNTREEAIQYLRQNPYHREWDARALEVFIRFALTSTPEGRIRTKTLPPLQEAVMLFERRVVYETWELLESIPPSITMHWVWGGKSTRSGSQSIQAQTSFRRAANSTNDYHPKLGHMVSTLFYFEFRDII
ncbi:Alpha/beta hydrolase family-domain-containing protein [Trametes punicea]|nr:Alpha/beta hydrolase family-domain-containing protein [Trametes punicea]